MKIIRFGDFNVNESIIDFDTKNIRDFYNTLKEELNLSRTLSLNRMMEVGLDNDIEVVNYETFYDELPDNQKLTAPPKYGMPAFALVNPKTKKARIVMNTSVLDSGLLDFIYHMLKHENVHVGQSARGGLRGLPPNPATDKVGYFSDKNEVMAFAQSIVDMLKDKYRTKKEAIRNLNYNPMYRDIKRYVNKETLKKYNKYIYLYLNKQYGEDKLGDESGILFKNVNKDNMRI